MTDLNENLRNLAIEVMQEQGCLLGGPEIDVILEVANRVKAHAFKQGYGNGYNAGKRKKIKTISQEMRRRKEDAFWQRAFLAALPSVLIVEGWKTGDKRINTLIERVDLARKTADEALRVAEFRILSA